MYSAHLYLKIMMKNTFAAILATGAIMLASCGQTQDKASGNEEATYETLEITLGDRTLTTEYSAAISGVQTVEIRPQVSGMITDILIEEGESVSKGQVLFVIDQTPYKAAYEIAVANVKSAEAAEWKFRQSLLDAGVEVNNAITLWQTAKKRVELDKKQILNLQASVWNTQLLMKHGNANYLEVLTAQKNLLQAELSEVSDRFDEIHAVINLYQALGGGY